jgi:hypothetical protein
MPVDIPPFPTRDPLPSGPGPDAIVVPDIKMEVAIALGVIGGLFVGSWAYKSTFVEGLEDHERKNIMKAVIIGIAVWGGAQIVDIDKTWWLNIEAAAEKVAQVAGVMK